MKLLPILLIFLTACGSGQISSQENQLCKNEVSKNIVNNLDYLEIPISIYCENCENSLVKNAINFWNSSYRAEIFYQGNRNSKIKIIFTDLIINENTNELIQWTDGFALRNEDLCNIQLLITDYDQTETLKHELGHCIGFQHSKNINSIVSGDIKANNNQIVTEEMKEILDCIIE